MDSKIRLESAISVYEWRLTAEPLEECDLDDGPGTAAYLIVISLLSLGLWAAIWGALVCFASAVLG